MPRRLGTAVGLCACAGALTALVLGVTPGSDAAPRVPSSSSAASPASATSAAALGHAKKGKTKTPIKHVVVIFDENNSYDHYFGTYPKATNNDGTKFKAAKGTPKNDNLKTAHLLHGNPNLYQPFRLSPSQAVTCDQNHNYTAEQKAYNLGAMNQFVQNVSADTCAAPNFGAPGLTMGYFDGNTVTGLWNYAQNFAMSDSFFGSNFGPSTPGAINLASGNTHGFVEVDSTTGLPVPPAGAVLAPDASGVGTITGDPQPYYDDCSAHGANHLVKATGRNVGDLMNSKGITWGWFQGGFAPTVAYSGAPGTYATCGSAHANVAGGSSSDYIPHHNPFSYYASTANPHHLPPTSIKAVGHTDQANHNYDLSVFAQALKAKRLPDVSFLKAPGYQDGHAGYSDPIDEQHFLVDEINLIQKSKYWKDTAIVVAYDDSDGWYDHRAARISNGSTSATADTALCTGTPVAGGYAGRCGPGPRLPLLVISPYARANYVDHHKTEQASILRFIEDNWKLGQIGDFSFDSRGGSIKHMFNFHKARTIQLFLKPNGAVKKHKGQ